MPSVYIKTYGCQMNERDSEAVAAELVAKGYTLAADIRRSRPNVVLGFMGCMAQSRGQELIDRLPDVDLVVGTQKFHRTPEHLDDIFDGRRDKIVDVGEEAGSQATI